MSNYKETENGLVPRTLAFSSNEKSLERINIIIEHLGVENRSAAVNYALKIASDAILRDERMS